MEQPTPETVLFKSDVAEPPVDIVRVANRFGINVFKNNTSPGLASLNLEEENDKWIHVNNELPWEYQRLMIAYQLANYFLDRDKFIITFFRPDHSETDKEKIKTVNYAMDLLMPSPWLEAYARYLTKEQLAIKFEVPLSFLEKQISIYNITVKG